MDSQDARCSVCKQFLATARSWQRCGSGHIFCDTCTPHLFSMELTQCKICQKPLMSEEDYARSQPSLEQQVMRAAGKMQITWWKYLFRTPDLVLVFLSWGFSLLFLISAGRNASFFSNILEWIVGSLFVALAPVLTLMYVRRKKSQLGMIAGWMTAWRGDLRPVWVIIGLASLVFLAHLMMESKAIG